MTTKSEQLFEKSKTCIPGGVNSPVRAFKAVKRTPVFMDHAKGSHIFDVDGNEYIDYVCSWGPGILGHAYDRVIEAVKAACDKGLTFGAPTAKEYDIAMTAGYETLSVLKEHPSIYTEIADKTKQLADNAKACFGDSVWVNQVGSLMSIFFTKERVLDMDSALTSDTEKYADYFSYMLDKGIYLAPSQFEAMFVSNAHTKEDIKKTCQCMKEFR